MEWARILAYISGTVDQELLLRNEYLATENRILRTQVKGRLLLSDTAQKTGAVLASLNHLPRNSSYGRQVDAEMLRDLPITIGAGRVCRHDSGIPIPM